MCSILVKNNVGHSIKQPIIYNYRCNIWAHHKRERRTYRKIGVWVETVEIAIRITKNRIVWFVLINITKEREFVTYKAFAFYTYAEQNLTRWRYSQMITFLINLIMFQSKSKPQDDYEKYIKNSLQENYYFVCLEQCVSDYSVAFCIT